MKREDFRGFEDMCDMFRPGAHIGCLMAILLMLFLALKQCGAQVEDPDFGRFDPVGYTGTLRQHQLRKVAQVSRAKVNGSHRLKKDTLPEWTIPIDSGYTLEIKDQSIEFTGDAPVIFVESMREINVKDKIFILGDNELDSIRRESFIEGYKAHEIQARRSVPSWILLSPEQAWRDYQLQKTKTNE